MIKTIPYYQFLRGKGSHIEILLYGIIEIMSFEKGYCYASNKYLAQILGVKPESLPVILSRISKKGWVKVELDEFNHRIGIYPRARVIFDDNVIEGLTFVNEGNVQPVNEGVECLLNRNNSNNIKKDNNSNNKLLLLGADAPKQQFGDEKINLMFEKWADLFGYKMKNTAANRRACYNLLRAKDKGEDWLNKTMVLLAESQMDKFAGRDIHSISNFADVQRDYEKIWKWGSDKFKRRRADTEDEVELDINKI